MVRIEIIENLERVSNKGPESFILHTDNWNDWGKYKIAYDLHFRSRSGQVTEIGWVKIAHKSISPRRPGPDTFYDRVFGDRVYEYQNAHASLPNNSIFSLGQDVEYYKNLEKLAETEDGLYFEQVISLLEWSGDLAYKYAKQGISAEDQFLTLNENVLYDSLLRNIELETVRWQYAGIVSNLVNHSDDVTSESDQYCISIDLEVLDRKNTLKFEVDSRSSKKTNLHAIIGANGLGKTQLLTGIYLKGHKDNGLDHIDETPVIRIKRRSISPASTIPNIIFVSLSAFDASGQVASTALAQRKAKNNNEVSKHYIGLGKITTSEYGESVVAARSPLELRNDLMVAMGQALAGDNKELWLEAVGGTLVTAVNPFDGGSKLANVVGEIYANFPNWLKYSKMDSIEIDQGRTQELPRDFINACTKLTHKLSSGHMATLYSLTKLAEVLQDRSVVLIDEPEVHLHPPLLAAYIRGLRTILSKKNALAIAVTHSPVVLQEIQKECVYQMVYEPDKGVLNFERPQGETYGENVGILTRRVFDLELRDTSFFADILSATKNSNTYSEALDLLGGSMGSEGRVALRSMTTSQTQSNTQIHLDKFGNPIVDNNG